MSTLQSRIRQLRGTTTQADFANELGIPINTLGRYERGVNNPDLDFLMKLNTKFGVSLDWIAFGSEEKQPTGKGHPEQANQASCQQCLALYARVDQVNERLYESMRENAALKEENLKLRQELKSFKNGQSNNGNASSMASAS